MNYQKIKIGGKDHPRSFCYAALEELENKYDQPIGEVLIKASSRFGTQIDIVHIGLKHGHRIAKTGETIEREFVADHMNFEVLENTMEIIEKSFPQVDKTEPTDDDKKKSTKTKLKESDSVNLA